MSVQAKVGIYSRIVIPSVLYAYEPWVMNVHERKKVEAVEMSCLQSICGVRRTDRVRNGEVRRRCGKNAGVGERMKQCVLRSLGPVERTGEKQLVRKAYESDISGTRCREWPKACWLDKVKRAL